MDASKINQSIKGTLWSWDHVIWELGNLGPQDFGTMGLMNHWKLNHGTLGQCHCHNGTVELDFWTYVGLWGCETMGL